jgi:cell division ATPase FtsA
MSQQKRRMSGTFIAGLDIGTTRTCAVIGELQGEGNRQPGSAVSASRIWRRPPSPSARP